MIKEREERLLKGIMDKVVDGEIYVTDIEFLSGNRIMFFDEEYSHTVIIEKESEYLHNIQFVYIDQDTMEEAEWNGFDYMETDILTMITNPPY